MSNLFSVSPTPTAADLLSLVAPKRSLAFLVEAATTNQKNHKFRLYLPLQVTADGRTPFKGFSAEVHGIVLIHKLGGTGRNQASGMYGLWRMV